MKRLLLLLALVALPSPAQAQSGTLTVFAAASLSGAFQELGAAFEREHPGTKVRFNFAGSQQLAVQLEHGARADIFASADERWMRYAADRGLLAAAPRPFAHNRITVIVPPGSTGLVHRLEDLARPGVKVVLAADAVPAGKYSREVLAKLDGAPGFPAGFSGKVRANVVSEEENVRAVVAKVQLGEADAGMVYASDVAGTSTPLGVLQVPEERNVTAVYPISPLQDGPGAALAPAFLALLFGPAGRRILERHGFLVVGR